MDSHEAVIVGAGFGGMGAAIQLKRLGRATTSLILEREDDLGGTWHVNHYPGLAVDIASVTYSYSFEPNPCWSHWFARGARAEAVRRARGRHVRPAPAHAVRRPSSRVPAGTRTTQQWEVAIAGGEPVTRDVPAHGDRVPVPAAAARHPRRRDFAGKVIHTGEVGRRPSTWPASGSRSSAPGRPPCS